MPFHLSNPSLMHGIFFRMALGCQRALSSICWPKFSFFFFAYDFITGYVAFIAAQYKCHKKVFFFIMTSFIFILLSGFFFFFFLFHYFIYSFTTLNHNASFLRIFLCRSGFCCSINVEEVFEQQEQKKKKAETYSTFFLWL